MLDKSNLFNLRTQGLWRSYKRVYSTQNHSHSCDVIHSPCNVNHIRWDVNYLRWDVDHSHWYVDHSRCDVNIVVVMWTILGVMLSKVVVVWTTKCNAKMKQNLKMNLFYHSDIDTGIPQLKPKSFYTLYISMNVSEYNELHFVLKVDVG